jgi:hypothetical protein
MNASKPHTRTYTIEHVALDAKLEAGSIMITHDTMPDDAYTIDEATRTAYAIDAASQTTGTGWHVAPLKERITRYIDVHDDTARMIRTTSIEIPHNYTVLQRNLNGTTQYALVSYQLMPHIPDTPKRTRVI